MSNTASFKWENNKNYDIKLACVHNLFTDVLLQTYQINLILPQARLPCEYRSVLQNHTATENKFLMDTGKMTNSMFWEK